MLKRLVCAMGILLLPVIVTANTYEVIMDSNITWEEAKIAAERKGGHLATITSASEWDEIVRQCGRAINNMLFLGGTDKGHEGYWSWITGEAWTYSNWNAGEPNSQPDGIPGEEDYLMMWESGKWNDTNNDAGRSLGMYRNMGYLVEYESSEPFVVTFVANNGTGTMNPQKFEANVSNKLSKNTYIKNGCVFQGWAETADGPVKYTDEQEITIDSDKTLYAVWGTVTYPAPENLQATEYHNQHPQGVKLTWSPVAGAPGYVILRKIVGENEFYPVGATPDTEYINKVATIPNVKDLKAQYTVAVADWQGNDPNTIVYLSPQSDPAWGSWRENPPPTVKNLPAVLKLDEVNAPFCADSKATAYKFRFNSYDKSRFVLRQTELTATNTKNGNTKHYTSNYEQVPFTIPAGEYGRWNFFANATFYDKVENAFFQIFSPPVYSVPVYFNLIECDGVNISGAKTKTNKPIPNWFKYWLRDGALDLLNDEHLFYGEDPDGNWEDDMTDCCAVTDHHGCIYLFDNAVYASGMTITVNGKTVSLQTVDNKLPSLYKCAEVIEHERGHRYMFNLRRQLFNASGGNLREGEGLHRSDRRWIDLELDKDGDGLPYSSETTFALSYPELVFNPSNPDSLNIYPNLGLFVHECGSVHATS